MGVALGDTTSEVIMPTPVGFQGSPVGYGAVGSADTRSTHGHVTEPGALGDAQHHLSKAAMLCSLAMFQAAVTYCQKLVAVKLAGFPYVASLAQPMCTSTVFGLLFLISRTTPTPEAWRALPSFAWIGFLLALNNFLTFAGSDGEMLPGELIVLLKQTTIPFTMIISCVFLVRKYTTAQLYGVLWVMVGIAGVMTVKFYLAGQSQSTQLGAAALLVAAQLPMSAAHVYMECSLKQSVCSSMWWMWCWVNVFEVFVSVPFAVAQMAMLGDSPYMEHLASGFQTLTHEALLWWLLFIAAIVTTKGLVGIILYQDSATMMWLASAAAIPISDILFVMYPPTSGEDHSSYLYLVNLVGLLVVMFGVVSFHAGGIEHGHENCAAEVDAIRWSSASSYNVGADLSEGIDLSAK